jgi:hypothetical protein
VVEGTLGNAGGSLSDNEVTLTLPAEGVVDDVFLRVTRRAPPSNLPAGFEALSDEFAISADRPERFDLPLQVELPYDGSGGPGEHVIVLRRSGSAFLPTTMRSVASATDRIVFEARDFASFVVTRVLDAAVPLAHSVSDFFPADDSWNIPNFGNYFAPGGNCLGMAAYAAWMAQEHPADDLFFKYSAVNFPTPGDPSIAQLTAGRAHLAQLQWWALAPNFIAQQSLLGEAEIGFLMKVALSVFDAPLVMIMQGSAGLHACVLFGYDADEFFFYDVNIPQAVQSVPFVAGDFGSYGSFDRFGFVMLPSLGRVEDFEQLTTEAEGGFSASDDIFVSNPLAGQDVTTHDVQLIGSLSGALAPSTEVRAFMKGVEHNVPVVGQNFNHTLPVSAGPNTMIVMAGVNIASQSLWFKNGATLMRDFDGVFSTNSLVTTLTWNQDNTDVDLYVTQPDGQTAWFADLVTSHGLTLDFDNVTGFGPEHITLATPPAAQVLPGLYVIRVHYYSSHGTGQAITGQVSVVVNENQPGQVFEQVSFSIPVSSPANSLPGSVGPDWVDIGVVDLVQGTFTPTP